MKKMQNKQKNLKKAAAWMLSMSMMISMAPISPAAADFTGDDSLLASGAAFSDGSQEETAPVEAGTMESGNAFQEAEESESTFQEAEESENVFQEVDEPDSMPGDGTSEGEIPDDVQADEEIIPEDITGQEEFPGAEENTSPEASAEDVELYTDSFDDGAGAEELLGADSSIAGYTYTIYKNEYAIIKGYTGTASVLEIPSDIDGYPVKEIQSGAFIDNKTITHAVIPPTIKWLGGSTGGSKGAFQGCTKLQSVTFRAGSEDAVLGANTFYNCPSLTSVTIPGNYTTIGYRAFSGCISLKTMDYKASGYSYANQTVESEAFDGCTALTTAVIPRTVKKIGSLAFRDCTNLTSVTLNEGLQEILSGAFQGDVKLPSVTIPSTVTCIGGSTGGSKGAFQGCTKLQSVTIKAGSADAEMGANTFLGCTSLTSIVIPGNYTEIGYRAFNGCTMLKTMEYKASSYSYANQSIGSEAFDGCTALTTVVIPRTVKTIGSLAFRNCTNLTSVTLNEGLQEILSGAFEGDVKLPSVTIPSTVTCIGGATGGSRGAFQKCTKLQTVTIKAGSADAEMGANTFLGCTSLASIVIPGNYTKIGYRSFYECTSLKTMEYKTSSYSYANQKIESEAFSGCTALTTIIIPRTVESIGTYAFRNCASMTGVTLTEGLKEICAGAFAGNTKLVSITIPSTVTCIGGPNSGSVGVFEGCTSLITVKITDNASDDGFRLGYRTFRSCPSLTYVYIPASYTDLQGTSIFDDNRKVLSIWGKAGSTANTFANDNGIPFNRYPFTLSAPSLTAQNTVSNISITWKAVENAVSYTIRRKTGTGSYVQIASTTGTSYTDKNVVLGNTYIYEVKAVNCGIPASAASIKVAHLSVEIAKCKTALSVTSYTYDGTAKKPAVTVSNGSAALVNGKDYTVAYSNNVHAGTASVTITGKGNYTGTVTKNFTINKAAQNITASITATSFNVDGKAKVTAKGIGKISYSSSNAKVASIDEAGNVKGLKPGKATLKVTAAGDSDHKAASKSVNINVTLATPAISSISNTASSVTLKWKSVKGASGYYIYRKASGGKLTKIAAVSGSKLSFADTKVKAKNGTVYSYTVRAYNGSIVSKYASSKVICRLTRPTISKASNSAGKKIAVKWNKNSKASGYQICYKTGSTQKTLTVKGASALTKTIAKLAKGKTYTITVRSYKKVSGKTYYSAWSTAKKVKVTK